MPALHSPHTLAPQQRSISGRSETLSHGNLAIMDNAIKMVKANKGVVLRSVTAWAGLGRVIP